MEAMEFPEMVFAEVIQAKTIKEAVHKIVNCLEERRRPTLVVYFHGWDGLGASAVLNSVVKEPPPALRSMFDRIIHIDCSKWKNRRAIQRTISQELQLPKHVMDIFARHDEEEDFVGVDEGSRTEIRSVSGIINQALAGLRWLVVLHNGSNRMLNLNDFGIPHPDQWSNGMVLWTYSGRLRGISRIYTDHDDGLWHYLSNDHEGIVTHMYVRSKHSDTLFWTNILHEEATEIAKYTNKIGVTSEIAEEFCRYLLSLNRIGEDGLDFNWPTHASNYWVCDGITQEFQQEKVWEIATALHEQIRLGDFSSHEFTYIVSTERWIVATSYDANVQPETTSFFLLDKERYMMMKKLKEEEDKLNRLLRQGLKPWTGATQPLTPSLTSISSARDEMFQRAEQLHVLKLCYCKFSFSSPPFRQCQNIRFLGLDTCLDLDMELTPECLKGDDEAMDIQKNGFFQRLYVFDISHTNWELNLSPDIIERVGTNMREINIKQGRIWDVTHGWTWRHLKNVHKLRVIEPTRPWETGSKDQFTGMVKLELLDLSGSSTMKVLPSLSSAISLRNLVLDGCHGLEHVVPGTLPPSLETFSFDAGGKEAQISHISMAGCTRLVNFILRGSLWNLEDLDLSNTSIKSLDLRRKEVQVPYLRHVILMGCEQLCAILWPYKEMRKLKLLSVDTRGDVVARPKTTHDAWVCEKQGEHCHALVSATNMRFVQSLLLNDMDGFFGQRWIAARFNLNLCLSTSKDGGGTCNNDEMYPFSTEQLVGSPLHKPPILSTHQTYIGVNIDDATTNDLDGSWSWILRFPSLDIHVDIGEGIRRTTAATENLAKAMWWVMDSVQSLVVHDNSCITMVSPRNVSEYHQQISWPALRMCRIERCPKLDSVFNDGDFAGIFPILETFWADDLLMIRCIWSKGEIEEEEEGDERDYGESTHSAFAELRTIHIQFCPRLIYVLSLEWFYMSSLEALRVICCADLTQIFPVDALFLNRITTGRRRGVLEFPELKHLHLYELPKLHQICEVKMFAPKLKTITVRGCWSLRRIPATADRPDDRPVVDCEKDWWEKLEWDGREAGHHPSLFETRHSMYGKKTLLRVSALR